MMTPTDFIKKRCREEGVDYHAFMMGARSYHLFRSKLAVEIHQQFPTLSSTRIGMLFGGAAHATIINYWKDHGYAPAGRSVNPMTESEKAEVIRLHENGMSTKAIAAKCGRATSTIRKTINPEYRSAMNALRGRDCRIVAAARAARRAEAFKEGLAAGVRVNRDGVIIPKTELISI